MLCIGFAGFGSTDDDVSTVNFSGFASFNTVQILLMMCKKIIIVTFYFCSYRKFLRITLSIEYYNTYVDDFNIRKSKILNSLVLLNSNYSVFLTYKLVMLDYYLLLTMWIKML